MIDDYSSTGWVGNTATEQLDGDGVGPGGMTSGGEVAATAHSTRATIVEGSTDNYL